MYTSMILKTKLQEFWLNNTELWLPSWILVTSCVDQMLTMVSLYSLL